MCGICGILNYGHSGRPVEDLLLKKMSDSLAHRGPDDAGTFVNPGRQAGFGFRRLAIVDLSPAGHQPMHNPDGNVTIMLNGEIYNHLILRKVLEAKGYRYRSRSDTETVLFAYQEYGIESVHKLLGMFAIAIWDEQKQRLLIVRDRIGIKPLYYTFANGNFVFGSEIKSILLHPDVHRELDEEALNHYLTFLIPPAPLTMFKGIHKLEAGHWMTVDGGGNIRKEQYWDPVAREKQPTIDLDGSPVGESKVAIVAGSMTEEEHIGTLRAMLKQSIKDRMMSDVPFGVFLSGGIDSSTNVALMAELMDRPVDTFSVGFRDLEKYNELGYARRIASQFKTNHREVLIDQKVAFEFLPKLVFHQDEPLADPVCIPLYFVSKLARDSGTIVVQVGEGSDEQFAGYPWMLREWRFYNTLWKAFTALPQAVRSMAYGSVRRSLERRGSLLVLDYIRKAVEGNELFWGGAINFTETHKKSLLNGRWGESGQSTREIAHRWHQELLDKESSADYLKRMIYIEFKNRLPELLLMRVDKMSMASSVEARVPFLDHRIVEYSMAVPARLKIKNGQLKYLLKKSVEGIIPNDIIYRKKQGFAAPVGEWLRGEWSGFVEDKLLNSWFVRNGHFNREFIKAMLENHQARRRYEGQNLWNLLNLTLWHESWIEGKNL